MSAPGAPSTAWVFPGQGSQRIGMGSDLAQQFPDTAGAIYAEADEVLGYRLSDLCRTGPEDVLARTEFTQPAIFTTSIAILEVLRPRLPRPVLVAGHSLGEYAALVAAGVLDWRVALRLVAERARLMAEVNERTPGGMAAAIGLPEDVVGRLCADAAAAVGGTVEIANLNDSGQTVVSGTDAAVDAFVAAGNALIGGGTADFGEDAKVKRLRVGAPFHSSLMAEMARQFTPILDGARFAEPTVPVVVNVEGVAVTGAAELRAALARQLTGAVQWVATMNTIAAAEVTTVVEMGPGRVLTGFFKRDHPRIDGRSAADLRRINGLLRLLGAHADGPASAGIAAAPVDRLPVAP